MATLKAKGVPPTTLLPIHEREPLLSHAAGGGACQSYTGQSLGSVCLNHGKAAARVTAWLLAMKSNESKPRTGHEEVAIDHQWSRVKDGALSGIHRS